jgi:hypothetical protein
MEDKETPLATEKLSVSNDKAADLIGIEPPSLDKDRRVGHLGIPYVKAGTRVLYCVDDLREWLDANKRNPANGKDGANHG